jgi:FkbM family methyltransferase
VKFIIKIVKFLFDSFIFIVKVLTGSYRNAKISYSQYGEDLIIKSIFDALKIKKPSYLDIGASDPVSLSNTYLFYTLGCKGVLVEPDPALFFRLKIKRRRDTCLNIGIGTSNSKADFYIMSSKVLNTFSKEEAIRYQEYGTYKIEKTIKVQIKTVNDVIEENFDKYPNFVSLDVEGLELAILN